jgi:hypothetical protein
MPGIFSKFLSQLIGAFIAWSFKGFKGKFTDEIAGPNEYGRKRDRNIILSLIFTILVLSILYDFYDRKEHSGKQVLIEYRLRNE